jgi:hypothetical protein
MYTDYGTFKMNKEKCFLISSPLASSLKRLKIKLVELSIQSPVMFIQAAGAEKKVYAGS